MKIKRWHFKSNPLFGQICLVHTQKIKKIYKCCYSQRRTPSSKATRKDLLPKLFSVTSCKEREKKKQITGLNHVWNSNYIYLVYIHSIKHFCCLFNPLKFGKLTKSITAQKPLMMVTLWRVETWRPVGWI